MMNALIRGVKRVFASRRSTRGDAAGGTRTKRCITLKRLTVGLGVASDKVRAVGVVGDTVRWAIELERSEGEPLGETLGALLARCPLEATLLGRWMRPRVSAAIGPSAVQVKRLTGLPPLQDPVALTSLVREGVGRFFLRNGIPLMTTEVRIVEAGMVWAAAFEAPVVEQLERSCREAGLKVSAVVPAAIALAGAVSGERVLWRDGEICADLTFDAGKLASVRRLSRHVEPSLPHSPQRDSESGSEIDVPAGEASDAWAAESTEQSTVVPALAPLGERSLAFADAYGATRLARDEHLALRTGSSSLASAPSRTRLRVACAALVVASGAALVAPGLRATHAASDARARLRSIDADVHGARIAERELGRVTDALSEVASFERSRRSTTMLLAGLTRALPKGAALVAFQVDTSRGTLVALGTRAAQITTALEKVRGIASPEIVGPVTREMAGGREVERVTIRFRVVDLADSAYAATSAYTASSAKPATPETGAGGSR